MQNFETDLPDLLSYAKIMLQKLTVSENAMSIVADAYLQLFDEAYSKENLKKRIADNIRALKNKNNTKHAIFENGKYQSLATFDLQCKKCKEVLPASMFRIEKSKDKLHNQRTTCIECEKKIDRERKRTYDKNKKNNPNKKKPYNSAYFKAYIQTLPNSYIIDVLRKQGHARENITDEMIENKREALQQKREKKRAV